MKLAINQPGRLLLLFFSCAVASACFHQRSPGVHTPVTEATPAPEFLPPGYVRSYVVFGERYYILGSSAGFAESGLASWYGPNFNGRPTATGETFDMHQMTAAHKSLPLPTMARVTNLANRRSIVVRVNDRGPFVDDRIIDLSYAAAVELDMIGPGTAPVEVVALNATAATAEATPTTLPDEEIVYIQVGAFAELQNALNLVTQLEQSGFSSVTTQEIILNGDTLYRVKIGPLGREVNRVDLLDRLKIIGQPYARLVTQ